MDEQEKLEARYRNGADASPLPESDPFPRMIIVCVGITLALLMVILAFLFVDFIVLRPETNVRPAPVSNSLLSNPLPPQQAEFSPIWRDIQ